MCRYQEHIIKMRKEAAAIELQRGELTERKT